MEEIMQELYSHQDLKYREFNASLLPSIAPETVIGVRTPVLRAMAKEIRKEGRAEAFLAELPHQYFEENQLHAFLLSEEKDYGKLMEELERFLPCIDNWGTCDQLRPKIFKKHRPELLRQIEIWITDAAHPYTVRFAIGMLMCHYLEEDYEPRFLDLVAKVQSEEYYVRMMAAWYFATALAKQYEDAVKILEQGVLDPWVHNKTIQKARESFRISEEQKIYLKSLKK